MACVGSSGCVRGVGNVELCKNAENAAGTSGLRQVARSWMGSPADARGSAAALWIWNRSAVGLATRWSGCLRRTMTGVNPGRSQRCDRVAEGNALWMPFPAVSSPQLQRSPRGLLIQPRNGPRTTAFVLNAGSAPAAVRSTRLQLLLSHRRFAELCRVPVDVGPELCSVDGHPGFG